MTCREFVEFVWKYVARELATPQRFEFDAHLAVCPHCVNYLQTYEQTIVMGKQAFEDLDAEVPADVPEDLVRAILAARSKPSGTNA